MEGLVFHWNELDMKDKARIDGWTASCRHNRQSERQSKGGGIGRMNLQIRAGMQPLWLCGDCHYVSPEPGG